MKLLTILILAGLWSPQGFGQTDTLAKPATTDTTVTKSSLTIGVVYANNASYYGQRAQENIPYVAAGATFRFRSGFYLSGLAFRILNDTSAFVSAGNLGGGIAFKLSKKWSADLSYNHTFYPQYSPFLQASSPDNASAALVYETWVNAKLNVDYAFGKTTDVFATAGISKVISLGSITSKDVITTTPEFNVVGGTQHFYQTYITEKRLRDSLLGVLLTPIVGAPPSQGGTTTTTTTTTFSVLSYNFKFPLAYSRANYMFELEYQLAVLSNKAQSGPGQANSFFNVSFYYQF
jgi:hypothetical protein